VSSSSTESTVLVDVLMPQMGTSVVEGTLIEWSKAIGDQIEVDETICEVSTDKIDTECPSPAAGTVAELLYEVGDTVPVGEVIARLSVASGMTRARGSTFRRHPPSPSRVNEVPSTSSSGSASNVVNGFAARLSPVVARIAMQHGLDLSAITGTGRGGRLTKRDALAAVAAMSDRAAPEGAAPAGPANEPLLHSDSPYRPELLAATAPPSAVTDLGGVTTQLSRIRQSIGAAMLNSQATTATCHTLIECDMTAVERLREEIGTTALPIVARAVIDALRDFPDLNATLDGVEITRYEHVHLGIAVSLGDGGLIVPVIHHAQNLAAMGLAASVKQVASRARANSLTPDDVRGGTFTITNPGAYGALLATPVINVPQVGILDLEAIVRRPVVVTDARGGESIAIRPMANLILGWDHRAMDGIYAARFLSALRGRLEDV
jgi:pyruvate dehydrogenase E2 component (dihydrolipoyllysine-residue acetyltransferase)